MKRRTIYFTIIISICFGGLLILIPNSFFNGQAQPTECEVLGWFPDEFGLKDHSVFIYDDYYYLVSINVPVEEYFAYARSQDLCHWEDLSPVLTRQTGYWDDLAIWAPHVIEEDGVYYMFYTGVKGPYPYLTQSIMLATSTNPADPDSWTVEGMVFQPDHPDMVWQDNAWADCRDPMVIEQGNIFYMFYTGRDRDGRIVGFATSDSLAGKWVDYGSTLTLETGTPESPFVWQDNGGFYLLYNHTGLGPLSGEKYRFGPTTNGPWSDEIPLSPGWAHEIWSGMDGSPFASYLTNYSVTIQKLIYNTRYNPPRLFIGAQLVEKFLPFIQQ